MSSPASSSLRTAARQLHVALALLLLAGLRHHLVWGESDRLPFNLRPWLDAGETACLVGFAWFGTRGWLLAIGAVRERTPGLRALVRATLPLLALAVLVPAFLSADVADYVMRGRVLSLHGGNPYVQLASDFPDDPFLAFGDAAWKQFPLPYGPLVAELQGGLAWLGAQATFLPPRQQFIATVLLFKLAFAAAILASAWLSRAIAARLRGGDGDTAFVAIGFCPLLLNEAVAQAHNESLLLLCVLASVWAAIAARPTTSALALAAGVLTKFVPAALAPLGLVHAVRTRQTSGFLLGGLLGIAVFAGFWWRFFTEPASLDFLRRQTGVTCASFVWAATEVGIDGRVAQRVGQAVAVVVLLLGVIRCWRRPDGERLLHGAAMTLAAIACCALAGFGPWYHCWWIPLALLGPAGWLRRFAFASVAMAPLGHVVWTATRSLGGGHQSTMLTVGIVVPALLATFARRDQRSLTPAL